MVSNASYYHGNRNSKLTLSNDTRVPLSMPTLNMPSKGNAKDAATRKTDEHEVRAQTRPQHQRFRLQVDRQTKASFDDRAAAEKRAQAIKHGYPNVDVVVSDA